MVRASAEVIQRVATRRSKQTGQHKQHLTNTNPATNTDCAPLTWCDQQGGPESAEQSGSAEWTSCSVCDGVKSTNTGGWSLMWWWNRCCVWHKTLFVYFFVNSPFFSISLSTCASLPPSQVWRMPYSLSLNLCAAPWMCCHREKKWKLAGCFFGKLKLCLILCF